MRAMSPLPIPEGPSGYTAEWVRGALTEAGAPGAARLDAVEVDERFADDRGIGGQVVRVRLRYADGAPPDAPASLVAKMPSAYGDTRRGGAFLSLPERELRFYRELAPDVPFRTARCWYADIDGDGDNFVLLLEDLGALPYGDDEAGATPEAAERVIGDAAALHAAWWRSPRLEALSWLPPYEVRALLWQRNFATAWRSRREAVARLLPPELLPLGEALTRRLAASAVRLGRRPRTLLHGDLRLDNLFFPPDGERPIAAIDWSNLSAGPGAYDLAYFLSVALTPEERRARERDLLRRYLDALAAHGVDEASFEATFEDYRLSFLEPFARMVLLYANGHGEKDGLRRPYAVLAKFARNAGQAALDHDSLALLERD